MLEAGQTAPDFTLPDQGGDELTLSGLRGETVVLYFYPRADTPGWERRHLERIECAAMDPYISIATALAALITAVARLA